MKEFVLSLLSRGYSHVVRTDGSSQYGRLEVCFEPEDYFIWKSQPPVLRLSSSGRLLSGLEPTPPKTYSTRRGPLILYSEDFALSSCQPAKINRKGRAFGPSQEEVDIQFHSLQDLTEGALAYGKKQAKVGCHASIPQPMLPDPKYGTKHLQSHQRPGEECSYPTQTTSEENEDENVSSSGQDNSVCPRLEQVRYQPRFLCLPRPHQPPSGPLPLITPSPAPRRSGERPHLAAGEPATSKPKGPEECSITRDRKRSFRTEVGTPGVQMSPIPESDAWEEHTEQPEDQKVAEHLTGYPKDLNGEWKQSAIETGGEEGGRSLRPAYTKLSLGCSHLSGVTNDRRYTEGGWHPGPVKRSDADLHMRRVNAPPNPSFSAHHLPPIKQALPPGSESKDNGLKTGSTTRENHRDFVPRLPDIHHPEVSTKTTAPKPPERTILRKVLVLLPSPMEQDGLCGLPEEEEEIEDVLCSGVEQKDGWIKKGENRPIEHGCRLKAAEQDHLIWFEPEEDKEHAVGPLPPFVGRRGLGKQCSMALYRQDLHDPADPTGLQSGIIRGSLPLELRECQKGGVLGTLIMGPAGEIIRLSFWDPLTDTEDHPALEDAMREHVLRVMTSEGVLEQAWTILDQLEEQTTQTGRMNDRELEAKRGHKKQTGTNREDKPRSAEHIKVVEMAECSGTDGRRIGKAQACAPEQRTGKMNSSTETQPYRRGEDIKKQMRGRTQSLQPEGRRRPGSPTSKYVPASSPQKTALPTPTSVDEHFDKTKPKSQRELFKDTAKSRKAGGVDTAEDPQIRKVKKKDEFYQPAEEVTDIKYTEKKTVQTNKDTESQDTSFPAETAPGLILKKNKKVGSEKPKTESTKSQNTVKKVKKKSKGQAAFIVGKPRQSQEVQQIEKKIYSPERSEKTISNTVVNESEDKPADNHCGGAPGHTMDVMEIHQVSVFQETRDAGHSLDSDRVSVLHEDCVPGHSLDSDRVSVLHEDCVSGHSLDSDRVSVSREDHVAGQNLDIDQVSDFQERYVSAVSSRSHSSAKSSCTSTWSFRRTSVSTDTGMCSPVPRPLPHLSLQCAVPTHHPAPSPAKSESTAYAKGNEEAINLRDSKAASLAVKAERRRLEVERKRKEKEEERKRQQEREEREQKMRLELEEEQIQRAEQARLKKLKEEEERKTQAEREMARQRREQIEIERERRRQEEKRRLLERLQRQKHEEEARRAAELKRQQQEEEARREEEWRRLQEMEEDERLEYLRRRREEEEERRKAAEERRRVEEEAAMRAEEEARLLAELFTRQREALEQQLKFHKGLFVEAEGLEQMQDISRPWVSSYFSLLKLLDLADCNTLEPSSHPAAFDAI